MKLVEWKQRITSIGKYQGTGMFTP